MNPDSATPYLFPNVQGDVTLANSQRRRQDRPSGLKLLGLVLGDLRQLHSREAASVLQLGR